MLSITWATFARNFVAKNFQKSPNLVTLLPPYLYRFPRHVLLKLNNCPETVLISRLNFAAAAEPIRFLKPKLLVHEALHEHVGRNCATWAKFEKSRAIFLRVYLQIGRKILHWASFQRCKWPKIVYSSCHTFANE